MDTLYIKEILGTLYPKRIDDEIEGEHDKLEEWKAWYSGKTKWHTQKKIVKGEEVDVEIMSGGIAKTMCEKWSSSFLNEKISIIVDDKLGNDKLQKIFEDNGLKGRFSPFVEKYFALGIGATMAIPSVLPVKQKKDKEGNIKTVLSKEKKPSVKISTMDAVRFIPITATDEREVTEAAIVKEDTNKVTVQLHVINETGTYDIVECVGKKKDTKYVFDYENATIWNTHQEEPLFQAWYPQVVDNQDLNNRIGTSCFSNAIEAIKGYDMCFDRFFTEFKNGAKKRILSGDLITYTKDGKQNEVVLGEEDVILNNKGAEQTAVNEFNPQLRVESFIRGLEYYISLAAKQCGLGDSAFQMDSNGRPLQTATAAMLKNQDAVDNIIKNESFAKDKLKDLCMAIKYVYNTFVEANGLTYEKEDIQISFDDSIIEDTTSKKQAELSEVNAGAMSLAEFRSHWYDEDYDTALKFVQENGMLIDKYINAMQSGLMTPKQFCKLVYGTEDLEVIDYITEHMQAGQPMDMSSMTESGSQASMQYEEEDEEEE